ncbi:MAG: alpha-ketoglutarate-dependent dioxygenase AlkB [Oscillatoriales cyanobacterium]|uniref:alpha-ketoglutarate-dependent dioxygenase AlkB n=1 Tax=unclassified Microcoleus TaxID=2642155 RepID=UPI001D66B72B|nr:MULTISPECIES: alpha-ketoglutarate-dependent dioxygenase AlkB [unclassified Microcoleus]TAF00856.1 MAG: alpha-ketoglutarate-dependent dioxygenase AlkB [Oscillatoriales cyanobacterium]MCC3459806.1 alpha-ketoglutarate-dependent dioxygenase AlkB [Microcoleus sp. PH2017_11_PCY_U_A]MCC3478240.1 alpha-ketoglutarate-dependent dioxygenase AlkB [Microcoleus sp. PH2017_12_PCY_D_A]TAF21385.1 MAG: alpha-ketoglutarate-dependent dioxygenase AlkB [Oscillatoriales cyanobacterium]TAF39688.1 MAG: alpha-ketogl
MLHLKQILTIEQQFRLVELCREIATIAPFITQVMPRSGQPLNCQQTSCGKVGWITDINGYRYDRLQPNKNPFPPMPDTLIDLAVKIALRAGEPEYQPETCLINYYRPETGKLGVHQDNSESNLKPAIISISLGDDCEFVVGGTLRSDPLQSITLRSGDILVLHGESRLAHHGVKRIIPNTAPTGLLKNNGRLNLTIRQVF